MGAYFLVVNPAKRQYLDPGRFGEPVKFSNVLAGAHCLRALKLLIADCFRPAGASFRGAWLGDPVFLASDDYGLPDPPGQVTATAVEPSTQPARSSPGGVHEHQLSGLGRTLSRCRSRGGAR